MSGKIPMVALLALVFCAATATAEVDQFEIQLGPQGEFLGGSGTGHDDGTGQGPWYFYDNTDWWNQWFYNGPKDTTRWKEVDVWITIDPAADAEVEIVYNWATCEWPPDLPPPLPDPTWTLEEEQTFIGRTVEDPIYVGEVPQNMDLEDHRSFKDVIPFNPEWISIDVRGRNVLVVGTIDHRCVPEPATLALFAAGGVLLLRRRRRR